MPDGAVGRAFGSSKKGMSSENPDIVPECSDSAAKDQKCLRFVPVWRQDLPGAVSLRRPAIA
ncbi:hypothetical protein MesoLj131a_26730 [Mesorhizobium sp. 131-2-1]|nr:hypothetical protein MesoLj131a_26730 [Mesorhizobium sp. 131-2-1]